MKNVLIISASPAKDGNTDLLSARKQKNRAPAQAARRRTQE